MLKGKPADISQFVLQFAGSKLGYNKYPETTDREELFENTDAEIGNDEDIES
jgi:hypothetical protein